MTDPTTAALEQAATERQSADHWRRIAQEARREALAATDRAYVLRVTLEGYGAVLDRIRALSPGCTASADLAIQWAEEVRR